jgi:transcriptional regulator with XRE-family HTH domain
MIGSRIKKMRKMRNLSQFDLGKGFLSVSYISRIENGHVNIPSNYLQELARRLEVSVEDLYGTKERKESKELISLASSVFDLIYENRMDEAEIKIKSLERTIEKQELKNEFLNIQIELLNFAYCLKRNELKTCEKKRLRILSYPIGLYPDLLFSFLRLSGNLQYKRGKYIESLKLYSEALEVEISESLNVEYANLLFNLSLNYLHLKDIQRSYYYIVKCIDHFDRLGCWYEAAEANIILGCIWQKQQDYKKATLVHKKALKLGVQLKDSYLQSLALHNLGVASFKDKEYKSAYNYWQESLFIKKKLGNNKDISITIFSLAKLFFEQKNYDMFLDYINSLNEFLRKDSNPLIEARKDELMGHYFLSIDNLNDCISSFTRAIELFQTVHNYPSAAELCFKLATHTNDHQWYKECAKLYNHYHSIIKI